MEGIIPLWKPKGLTSHDCVFKIRKMLHMKKVGHTGTLDPDAEGVLPICIGQATKIVPFLTDVSKTYTTEITLGAATETEDATGEIVTEKVIDRMPTRLEIEQVLDDFIGEIVQIPPMYSAVKVNGKKLYEYAREHEAVERPERTVTIYGIDNLAFNGETSFSIRVQCSKGTYIRTLGVDIGKKLGYPAHMSRLTRDATGMIGTGDTVTFDQIQTAVDREELANVLMPISRGLTHLVWIKVDEETKRRVLFGQKLPRKADCPSTEPFVVMNNDQVLAIYETHPDNDQEIKPVRVFSR